MTAFTERDHERLARLFEPSADNWGESNVIGEERVPYAGYRPTVREAPNGDTKACPVCTAAQNAGIAWHVRMCPTCDGAGRVPNVDAGPAGKRYLHVSEKYLAMHPGLDWPREYLARAHWEACRVAEALGVPAAYYPRTADGTLRVLEYPSAGHVWRMRPGTKRDPIYECSHCLTTSIKDDGRTPSRGTGVCPALAPGAGTAEYTDFCTLTVNLWRSTPEDHLPSLEPYHLGEIAELIGIGPARKHSVPARPYAQRALVYFAMPDHAAVLPDGRTVAAWLAERIARSRY